MESAHHGIWHREDAHLRFFFVKLRIYAKDSGATTTADNALTAATMGCSVGADAVPLSKSRNNPLVCQHFAKPVDCFPPPFFFILVKYTSHKLYRSNRLNVQFSGIKFIPNVLQPPPLTHSRTFSSSPKAVHPHYASLPQAQPRQPLVYFPCLRICRFRTLHTNGILQHVAL